MSEPFLIAHVVRGEPAFDIAEQISCPVCEPIRQGLDDGSGPFGCEACDYEGKWWIIPTSGHRARPYWLVAVKSLNGYEMKDGPQGPMPVHFHVISACPQPVEGWPDHFPCNNRSSPAKAERLSAEALLKDLGL